MSKRALALLLVLAVGSTLTWARDRGAQQTDIDDGPYLIHEADGAVTATWVRDGDVQAKHFDAGKPIVLPEFASLLGSSLTLAAHEPDAAIWEMPEKVLALSDVEGRYDEMLRFLTANGVVDADGKWAFGKGHLVCVGDMVDRGSQVTETLWLMYRLGIEARAAGGHVHYVLGNHEAMLMGGDVRYVAPKYRAVAKLLDRPIEGLVGADTELGRWMRTRNAMVRIGRYVFVHAGIAPGVALDPIDYDHVNGQVRSVLGVSPDRIEDRAAGRRVWGRESILWYRGYFARHADEFGAVPSSAAMDRVLGNVGGEHVVVGHTKVGEVTPLIGGRVLAIDIPWSQPDHVRALLITKDAIEVVDIRGERTAFELPAPEQQRSGR